MRERERKREREGKGKREKEGAREREREREREESWFICISHTWREAGEGVLEQMSICIFNSGPPERDFELGVIRRPAVLLTSLMLCSPHTLTRGCE